MSRTTATVLFTDLVGSTELRGRLGEEAADELRRRHDQLLAQVVEANNGRVVKGLGDGIMATFGGASDAVAAAVAIQQGIDRLNRTGKAPAPLAVRVGISAGDVSFEDGDVHGTAVIEASRLCEAAGGNEILVSEIVRLLAGLADEGLGDRGRLELKGLQKLVAAWLVPWQRFAVSSIPMPALLTDVGRIFVGREAELARLTQLWKEAAAGEQRVVLLAGEPGVGKTRLAAELATLVHEEGALVLAGRCDEDLGVPYQPFVEALRQFVDHTDKTELERRLGRYAGELTRLLPELAEESPQLPAPLRSDPETERYRLFDAVTSWVSAVSADQPFLLVLDDLQWAAKPTLLLLRHMVRSLGTGGGLVLATYRDTELVHDHPLLEVLADMRGQQAVERVSLVGLDASEVATFLEQASGQALDDQDMDLVRAIHDETEGNPFFVREVLRHLTETGALHQRDGRWVARLPVAELGIPEGVRDVVGRRLSRLSADANRILRVAAVVGPDFELSVLSAASDDLTEEELLTALEEATAARLVLETPGRAARYRFAHALVRDTLYAGISAGRRVTLHRRVAEVIASLHCDALDDQLPALAHHWARAADTTRAVEYATQAGDRALRQLAHDEAVTYYDQALDLVETTGDAPHKKLELLIGLGEAQRCAGDAVHRLTLLKAGHLAGELGDADAAARAALANQRGMFSRYGSTDEERVGALRAALDAMGPAETVVRARLLAALATELQFAGEVRLELGREALAIARRAGDGAALAEVLAAVCLVAGGLDPLPERTELATELSQLAQRLGDRSLEFQANVAIFMTASEEGNLERARAALRRCGELAEDLGQPMLRWRATYLRTHWAISQGRLDEAEQAAVESFDLGEAAGQPDAAVFTDGPLAVIRLLQGRSEEALQLAISVLEQCPAAGVYQATQAWALAELGRRHEAAFVLSGFRADHFARLPRDYSRLCTLVQLARTCSRLEDREIASELYELLFPHRGAMATGQVVWIGPVAHDLGLLASILGRYDDADDHFADAVARQDRNGAEATAAHSRLEWGRMLLTRRQAGDVDRARELLGQAVNRARELGLANMERRAADLLGAS